MADQKITINATPSKVKSISVSNATVANKIVATPDTSLYYSNLSKQWATKMDGLVVGEDYSSKYYAEKSKQSAEIAKMEASVANALVPQLREDYNNYNEQLIETKNTGIEEIEASVIPVMNEIETVTIVANNIDVVTDIGENLDNILNKTVKVGKTTTGEAGTQARVVNAGTNLNPVLDFTIPRGQKGDNGGMTAEYIEETETLDFNSETGTMLNPKWGNVTGDISLQDDLQNALNNKANKSEITNFATKTELNTKQPKGNYALIDDVPTQVSELENDSNFATQTQVMQAIASIPQFKLSIVDALPQTGEKMVLYFVPKDGEAPDIYNEYVWIEQTSSYEFLGSTAVDLTEYVKKTDYATTDKGGVIKQSTTYGFSVNTSTGIPFASTKGLAGYQNSDGNMFIGKNTLENIKNDLVKRAVTENDIELTDDEKTSARTWLGAIGDTDYASSSKAGVVKSNAGFSVGSTGYVSCNVYTLEKIEQLNNSTFISKGTLNNVLTQYSKTVSLTQAEYDALGTKDANTLYLIEE